MFKVGDRVRDLDTGNTGVITEITSNGRHWVELPVRGYYFYANEIVLTSEPAPVASEPAAERETTAPVAQSIGDYMEHYKAELEAALKELRAIKEERDALKAERDKAIKELVEVKQEYIDAMTLPLAVNPLYTKVKTENAALRSERDVLAVALAWYGEKGNFAQCKSTGWDYEWVLFDDYEERAAEALAAVGKVAEGGE